MNRRFALISDIHSNLEALIAVVAEIRRLGIETVWCLGDVVGYGPDPEETVRLVRSIADGRTLLGNHDYATLNAESEYVYGFNPVAIAAVLYQRDNLSPEAMTWLSGLPRTIRDGEYLFCHGSPVDTDHYLLDDRDFRLAFGSEEAEGARMIFFGHTHVPVAARTCDGVRIEFDFFEDVRDGDDLVIPFDAGCSYLINPGSVGQPRDGNPGASFAFVDPGQGTITFRRVAYDIVAVQRKIIAAGLPPRLAERLANGQ